MTAASVLSVSVLLNCSYKAMLASAHAAKTISAQRALQQAYAVVNSY